MEVAQLRDSSPARVSLEEHMSLKEKVRDLESCLHEMQEEFEEVTRTCVCAHARVCDLLYYLQALSMAVYCEHCV